MDFRPVSASSRRSLPNCGQPRPGPGEVGVGGESRAGGGGAVAALRGGGAPPGLRSRHRAAAPSFPRRHRSRPGSCALLGSARGSEMQMRLLSGMHGDFLSLRLQDALL